MKCSRCPAEFGTFHKFTVKDADEMLPNPQTKIF